MSAILKDDPPRLSRTGQAVPPGLERIIDRCLVKNAAGRFRSAHDLALALEAADSEASARSALPAVPRDALITSPRL